jgi:hypothetical protein
MSKSVAKDFDEEEALREVIAFSLSLAFGYCITVTGVRWGEGYSFYATCRVYRKPHPHLIG